MDDVETDEYGHKALWQPGETAWFEYHCKESHDSVDADLWYRSHQQVTVIALQVNDSESLSWEERVEAGMPFTYTVRFPDDSTGCAFEDELGMTTAHYCRPDPPKPRRKRRTMRLADHVTIGDITAAQINNFIEEGEEDQHGTSRVTHDE